MYAYIHTYICMYVYIHISIYIYLWVFIFMYACIYWRDMNTYTLILVQPITCRVSLNQILQSQSNWSLFNKTWQKRHKELESGDLRFEKWLSKCNRLYIHLYLMWFSNVAFRASVAGMWTHIYSIRTRTYMILL